MRQIDVLFGAYERDVDALLDAIYLVPSLSEVSRSDTFGQVSQLLVLSERNAERRVLNVRTLIRERHSELKAQNVWIFSGDASKRIRQQLREVKK